MRGRLRSRLYFGPCRVAPELCSVLADDTRVDILRTLAVRGAMCVSAIAQALDQPVSVVSNQLNLMYDKDLVTVEKVQKRRIYSLSSRIDFKRFNGSMQLSIPCLDGAVVSIDFMNCTRGALNRQSAGVLRDPMRRGR